MNGNRSSLPVWIAAWMAVHAASAVAFELWVPRGAAKGAARVVSHLHAFALHLLLALVCAALVDSARRFLPSPRARFGALGGLAALLGALLVEENLHGLVALIPGPGALWSNLLGAVGGVATPVAFVVGRWCGPLPLVRSTAILAALGVAVAHHRLLTSGYEGIHFAATCAAASLLGGTFEGWTILDRVRRPGHRASLALSGLAAAVAAAGAMMDPGSDAVVLSRRLPGNAIPAMAARGRQLVKGSAHVSAGDSAWLRDRKGLPPTKPTTGRFMPKNGIVVLLTIDAIRADVMLEPQLSRLPNFKRLAEASFSFPRARSAAPHTTPSLSALMMGRYYSTMIWSYGNARQPKPFTEKSPTIAEVLSEHGVESAAYPALAQVSVEYGLGRGFTEPAKRTNGAEKIVKAIVKRLKKGTKGGLFIYSHAMEPHAPYKAPGATDKERYLGEIAQVDEALGALLDVVLDSELSDRVALIISADHGEAFGEHDSTQHGTTLYDEMMRVPLFVRLPGTPPGSSPVAASLVDVGPTIMDAFGAPVPATFFGQSLLPVITGQGPAPDRPLILESGRMMRAIIEEDRWKYIRDSRHGTVELYDLASDPGELRNVHDEDPARAARLGGYLDAFFEVHAYRAPGYQLPYFP